MRLHSDQPTCTCTIVTRQDICLGPLLGTYIGLHQFPILQFGECFAGGQEVSGHALCECLGRVPKLARTSLQLAELETQHEMVNLYLWLSMRFPETFMDSEEAQELQEDIEQCISQSLEQGPSLKPSVRRQRKKLSRKQRRRHH